MKGFKIVIITMICGLFIAKAGYSIEIVSPKEGQEFYAGDKFTVVVKPAAGEQWKEVILDIFPMTYSEVTNDYREEVDIPRDKVGEISFVVMAYDDTGNKVHLTRTLIVKMPPDVVLESIVVYPDFILLYKLLPDDPPEEREKYEIEKISVSGIYSDGVKRSLTSSDTETTFLSSNSAVATVSPEGVVTAQSPGSAEITAKSGRYTARVRVKVKPAKRYPDGRIKFY